MRDPFVVRVQLRLRVAFELHPEAVELLQVEDRLVDAFPIEPIKRPKEHQIKPSLASLLKKTSKSGTLPPPLLPALVVDVFAGALEALAPRASVRTLLFNPKEKAVIYKLGECNISPRLRSLGARV